ncbi:splicing factor U2af large subunit B-like isoform X3 [Dendrobium catenatum]|uniref:splicing factor U2af large subunit B-like isoform X3 n=1 Tax=Dendrobium catenatum TaxID=906689 RepID=UPI0009F2964A|nr:splicing factor U2af large subunit B-like isoform X3 [Dendrobium catenatum]
MSETLGRYETSIGGYVGYGGESLLSNGAYSGNSRSQEHEQWSSKSRERGRVKEDKETNRDEESDLYMERERDKERDRHHGDHKDRSDRKKREQDRVDRYDHHRRRCRSEDHDRDRHGHRHRRDFDGYEQDQCHDADDYRKNCSRDFDRESERHRRHVSRSRSRDRSRHRSRSRSRSRSKSKRISGFDMPPPVMMPSVTVAGQVPGTTAAVPGMLPNIFPLAGGQVQFPTLPLVPVQAMTQQATRHARRVYVGSLSATANEQSVAMFFSQVMSAIGGNTAGPGDAVVNVYINYEKKFAFVEMRSVEEASNAMALDGIMFEGAPVKVRRPSDYIPSLAAALGSSQPNPNLNLSAVGLMPGSAGGLEGPDRIFVGGLPYYFTEAQVRELLESFGALRGFDLVKDRETGNSKGYAFCVYQDLSVTDIACAALNGIKMGDKTLTVRRANQGSTQPRPEHEIVLLQAQQRLAIEELALQVGSLPTKIVCLTQVVSADDLKDDEEYEEILDDMKGECGKYGNLVNVVIPRPGPHGEVVHGVGRVFLEYDNINGAVKARLRLHGRKFDGNQAVAVFYPENMYAKGEYGG